LEKRVFLLIGQPSVGKTTILAAVVSELRARGISVGGMFSREVKESAVRIGFEIVDVSLAKVGCLANVNQKTGPYVGKYRVNLTDLESIGTQSISNAVKKNDVVVIDEIGPMELFSDKFIEATKTALESEKLVIAVVHWKIDDKLIVEIKNRQDAEVFNVTTQNRDKLSEDLVERTVEFLKKH
jgi:nucleoside-triphosphatase